MFKLFALFKFLKKIFNFFIKQFKQNKEKTHLQESFYGVSIPIPLNKFIEEYEKQEKIEKMKAIVNGGEIND